MARSPASLKVTYLSATILALANLGDAFLYVYLPASYPQMDISAGWVGVILSINRFTRLFLNGWVAWTLSQRGLKTVLLMATIVASGTTVSYGFISAVPVWIVVRVLWGISFSTLRLGTTLYALEHPRKGIALGWSRAVMELGPVAALLAGPWLSHYSDRGFTFLSFGLITSAGILLALGLPDLQTEKVSKKDLILSLPSSFNLLVLIQAFITEGVLVVLLARLIPSGPGNPLAWVGLLLGYRRLSLVLLSPLSGWVADQWGFEKVFIYTTLFSAAGLACILSGPAFTGILITFTFSALNASVATGGAISSGGSFIKKVSDNTTWRDLGMASGSFAGALILSLPMQLFIPTLILLYAAGILYHLTKSGIRRNGIRMRLFLKKVVLLINHKT